jgi:hypothetical protein
MSLQQFHDLPIVHRCKRGFAPRDGGA